MKRFVKNTVVTLLAVLSAASVLQAGLPEPKTGGKAGGPIDMLLIKGHSEWAFGEQPELDKKYKQMLLDRGYRLTVIHEWQELNQAFLKQFNTVVYLNPSPYLGGGYYDDTNWRSGKHLVTVRKNTDTLRDYIAAGGGVLFVPTLEEMGMRSIETFNHLFEPYGLQTACAVAVDNSNSFAAAKVGFAPVIYSWTERMLENSPLTEGVKRIYYPSYCTRWDDNYTTIPLKPVDPAWQVLARGMPGSTSEYRRSSIYDNNGDWTADDNWKEPALMVARDFGKGRVAVIGISAWHLFYITYAEKGDVTESSFSRVAGIAMTEGNGTNKSDLAQLLDNTYRWLAQGALQAGMGGYTTNGPAVGAMPVQKEQTYLAGQWADQDPLCTGPIRPIKILVGARSAISSGSGSVAEWAKSAKAAGYDAVCFTETYENLKPDQWEAYIADCRRFSDAQLALLPGFDVESDLGDRFLLVGAWSLIRPHLLTPDRKKLFWTGHMLIGMGDLMPVIARPQWLASVRGEQGALPPDLYSHFGGIAVATYKDGKQVDDGFAAYKWHVDNASLPYPIAVHEVDAPGKLADAARTGLQSYVNSDTPEHALHYFRNPHGVSGGNPARYYVSNGPLVDSYSLDNWQAPEWKMQLSARSAAPITEVKVMDQRREYRRWTPNTNVVDLTWSGDLGAQHWFLTELSDAQGGRCILSPVRTLPPFHYIRCLDRQNFFGLRDSWLTYFGKMPKNMGVALDVPGVTLAAPVIAKAQMKYAGNRLSVLDWVIDSTQVATGTKWDPAKKAFVPGGRHFGADNSPMFNDQPIPEYEGRIRYVLLRSRASRYIGGAAVQTEADVELKLKKELVAQGDVWPILGTTAPKGAYVYTDATGKQITGTLTNGSVDLPAGGRINNLVALSPLRVNAAGKIGAAAKDGDVAKAGSLYRIAFTLLAPDALGLDGKDGFELTLKQGTMTRTAASVFLNAKEYGALGSIKEVDVPGWTNAPHTFLRNAGLTLRLQGANPRWAAGLWLPDGTLEAFNFLDGVLLGTLVSKPAGTFYFGNLITASHLDLNLSFAAAWTTNGGVIEVNNPTDKSIKAKVQTAAAITDRSAIKATVTVPAGSTRYVVSKSGKTEVADARPSPYEMPACLQGRKRILFYGDSLTDGSSYPDFVVNSLNVAFPEAGFTLENSAKCGDNTSDLLRRFDADVVAKKPDVVSICIGANDANRKMPVPEYKTNLQMLVRKLVDLKIQPILYLTSARGQKEHDDILLTYLAAVKEIAAEFKVPLVDAYGHFKALMADGKPVLGGDGLHHGPDGFPAMGRAFLDSVGLKEVKLVEKVTPWPGALMDWEVSAPVVLTPENKTSFYKLENAKDWKPFAVVDVLKSLEWHDQPFIQRGGVMPLAGTVGAAGQSRVAFARTTFEAAKERTAELQIGGAPPLYVYCNGELVWQQTAAHGYHPNADRVQVLLKKGKNEFVICTGYMAFLNLK